MSDNAGQAYTTWWRLPVVPISPLPHNVPMGAPLQAMLTGEGVKAYNDLEG